MKVKSAIQFIAHVNIFQFVRYNYLSKNVHRVHGKYIVPYNGTKFQISKSAIINLNGNLFLNANKLPHSKAECLILLRDNAKWDIIGDVTLYYGTTLQVHKGGEFISGKFVMNTGGVIICAYKMQIGDDIMMARNVYIFDSDHHPIYNSDGDLINENKAVVIGNHVWMGLKATIMHGADIGNGCMIGAHSLISSKVPDNVLVVTVPGRPIMKGITWKGGWD